MLSVFVAELHLENSSTPFSCSTVTRCINLLWQNCDTFNMWKSKPADLAKMLVFNCVIMKTE